jgi:hypothetical protein
MPAAGPDGIGSLGGSDSVGRLPLGDGMFKNQPVTFKIFREYSSNAHTALFPKFEGQPAIFVLDRQGRIAATVFGYEKGQLTKVVRAVIEEK